MRMRQFERKSEYRIDDKEKIIYTYYQGNMSIDDLTDNIMGMMKDSHFDPDYDVLTDARKCRFEMKPEELEKLIELIKKHSGVMRIKIAIVVDTPNETALSIFFEEMAENIRKVKIFSTYEGAEKWLKARNCSNMSEKLPPPEDRCMKKGRKD